MLKNYHNSPEMEALRDMKALLDDINNIFVDELELASKNAQKAKNAELQSTAENSEQKNNTTEDGGVKYSVKMNQNNEEIVWVDDNIFSNKGTEPVHQFIADYIASHIGECYKIIESGQRVYIGKDLPGEYTQSKYTQKILKNNPNIVKAKNRAVGNLGEMIEIATNRRWEKTGHIHNKDAKYGIYRYDTRFGFAVKNSKQEVVGANVYTAELVICNASDGKKYLYDIVKIKKDIATSDWLTQRSTSATQYSAGQKSNVSNTNVPQNTDSVNNNSMQNKQNNAEIKKSLKLSPDAKKVLEENPELKSAFLYLQSQFKLVKDYIPGEEQLMEYAKQLKKSNASTKDVYELKNDLRNIYTILHSMTDSRGLEYATNTALKLATDIMATSKILDEQNQAKQELRKQLNETMKNRKFRLTEEVKQEIIYHYGSWKDFVKNSRGVSMHLAT